MSLEIGLHFLRVDISGIIQYEPILFDFFYEARWGDIFSWILYKFKFQEVGKSSEGVN